MPTNFETLNRNTDITNTRTLLHEVIPMTGSIVSGTYSDENIKDYSHEMFQSVYDYPYLSSSANHIFDLTVGVDENSSLSGSSGFTQQDKKTNIYNQFSQILLGYTSSNNTVQLFESDLTMDGVGTVSEGMFLAFSRLTVKDQIKKGTFSLTVGTGAYDTPFTSTASYTDVGVTETQNFATELGGDYGLLYDSVNDVTGGIVFYQSGIVLLSTAAFGSITDYHSGSAVGEQSMTEWLVTGSIPENCDTFRHRLYNLSFNNTTEINSTVYFCRAPHNKFNYSSNPTYTNNSKVVVKQVETDTPTAYITTVGLYNSAGEMLAVAKLSEPIKKDSTNEVLLRVRLDY